MAYYTALINEWPLLPSGTTAQKLAQINAMTVTVPTVLNVTGNQVLNCINWVEFAAPTAAIILDQAGWHGAKQHRVPCNISPLPLPPRSPELNSQGNIWQFMRQNWLSDRVFKSSGAPKTRLMCDAQASQNSTA